MLFEASHRSRSAPAFCGGPHRKIAATGTKVDQKSFPGKPREESGKLLGKLQFSLPQEARDRQDLGERDQERGKKSRLCEAFILNCKLDGNGIFPSLTRTRGTKYSSDTLGVPTGAALPRLQVRGMCSCKKGCLLPAGARTNCGPALGACREVVRRYASGGGGEGG